jgi:hypothetical protein
MAAISTVKSTTTYYVQLVAFSAVAVAAVVFGCAAIARASWGRKGLLVLSWLGCTYFFGSSILVVIFVAMHLITSGGSVAASGMMFAIALGIAAPGIAFAFMARALGRSPAESDTLSQPT